MLTNTHTYFSLKYGTLSPKELLREAVANGYEAVALTDINNTSACMDFVRMAPDYNIHPVVGIDFRNGVDQQFVGLAKNNEGFRELNAFLSMHLHEKRPFKPDAPEFENCIVIYPFDKYPKGRTLRDYEYIGISPADVNKLRFFPLSNSPEKLLIQHTVSFRDKNDFHAHRLLRAIDMNELLSRLGAGDVGHFHHVMVHRDRIARAFDEYPKVVRNTERILSDCRFEMTFGPETPRNQSAFILPQRGRAAAAVETSQRQDIHLIKQLINNGLPYRYPNPSTEVMQRIEMELDIIIKKGFLSYFLINWDICRYARSKGYFYVGRGSGANSIIAYILRITDVDPIELDLYFERFINLYRKNPPDFDIDFSWKDRDDVTSYIFGRYENTALLATYNTFQPRATVRELGKVFGMPKHEVDKLVSPDFRVTDLDRISKLVLLYGRRIENFPNHLSVHSGGIIISEEPIHSYTGTFMPPKGYPTTQFDMVVAEDIGLFKFDILSQRGLGKIKDGVEMVRENNPGDPPVDIHDIKRFKEDKKIKELLRKGNALGCFYVESPAMRMLMAKLEVDTYIGLVAASSIIRPGVARSGMMRTYIDRYRDPEKIREAHPVLLDIMPETYGVMVYQEDVIKVAHYYAGLTLSEADSLRRGMSGKFRSRDEFQQAKQKFFENCREKGEEEETIAEVWRQVESFAGYAFAKGHSASYAVESYQSLFLKAHYPLEYMVATINNYGGFYSTEIYVHEARMLGAQIEAPCVNRSFHMTRIDGKTIYLGLNFVKGLEGNTIKRIILEREANGDFFGLSDLCARVSMTVDQLEPLVRVGAFRFTGKSKKELLWNAHFVASKRKKVEATPDMFRVEANEYDLPEFEQEVFEDAFDEIELLGFPLSNPFNLLQYSPVGDVRVDEMGKHLGKTVEIAGYLVHRKNTTTLDGKRMQFGNFLDRNGHFLDTVHFPEVAKRFPFRGRGIYRLTGKVVEEFGVYSMEVAKMERLPMVSLDDF